MKSGWDKHILLWGMMGTGKSTLGPRLADRMTRPFFDLDHRVEESEGLSVRELFTRFGEDHFRTIEHRVLQALLAQTPASVIALGGGTLLDAEVRQWAAERGVIVTLTAHIDALTARLQNDQTRPLLRGQTAQTDIEQLLEERAAAYRDVDYLLDTTGCTPEDLVVQLEAEIHYGGGPVAEGNVLSSFEVNP